MRCSIKFVGCEESREPSRPSRYILLIVLLCSFCLFASACGGDAGVVRGFIVEVTDRNLAEIESLTVRDDDERLWKFTTEEALEKDGAHLRLHQVLGQTIEVLFEEREGLLIAVGLRD